MPTTSIDELRNELRATSAALRRLSGSHTRALDKIRYAKKLLYEMQRTGGNLSKEKALPVERRARRGDVRAVLFDPYAHETSLCYMGKLADIPRLLSRRAHRVTLAATVPVIQAPEWPTGYGVWSIRCDDEALLDPAAPATLICGGGSARVISGCCMLVCVAETRPMLPVIPGGVMRGFMDTLVKNVRYITGAQADELDPARRTSTYIALRKDGHRHIVQDGPS